MGFAAGFAAGTSARLGEERLKLAKEEAAQNAKLKRQQLAQTRDAMNLKLMQAGYSRDDSGTLTAIKGGAADTAQKERDLQNQQIAIQAEAVRSLQGRLAANSTDAAIEEFIKSGDANVFQRALDNDPFLKQAWNQRGVQVISNIDFENDRKLLESAGINQNYINDPKVRESLKKSIWKYHDGQQWNVGLLDQLVAETGALKRMSTNRSDMIVSHMGRLRNAMKGINVGLEEKKVGLQEKQSSRNYLLKLAELDLDKRKLEQSKKSSLTTKQKNIQAAEKQTNILLDKFGKDKFWETDFNDPKNYRAAFPYLSKIESLGDFKLSEAEKKELNNIRQLIALADPSKKLSSADTGIIDQFLGGVNKYLNDNVGGLEAKSSYAAFRNTVRHALFGSALTEAEISSFNEAFGTLGQKLGPVLQQFRTNLVQVKAKLESMYRNGNPITMKVRMGIDQKKLDSIISALDKRIEYLSGKPGNEKYFVPVSAERKNYVSKLTKDEKTKLLSELDNPTEAN